MTDRPFVRAADGSWVPVGWLPAARDLSAFVAAAAAVAGRRDRSPVAVLGQRSPRYQKLSERLVHHLGELPSVRWGAERVTREDLVAGLGLGLGTAVYLGHGRPTGWAAYRGLRAAHLSLSSPLGALLSLTCWTASRRGVGTSFSEQVVLQGTAAAAVGAIRPVLHLDNTRIVVALAAALLQGPAPDVGSLLRAMLLTDGAPTVEAASYRLVGDPLASLSGADDVLALCECGLRARSWPPAHAIGGCDMTMTDLETDLRDLVAELAELPVDEVETDTSFEDAGIDSLLAMEIAVHVERRFGVRFEDTELKTVQSVRQLADAVREKQR